MACLVRFCTQHAFYIKNKPVKIKGMKEHNLPYTCLINDASNIKGDELMSSSKDATVFFPVKSMTVWNKRFVSMTACICNLKCFITTPLLRVLHISNFTEIYFGRKISCCILKTFVNYLHIHLFVYRARWLGMATMIVWEKSERKIKHDLKQHLYELKFIFKDQPLSCFQWH